MNNGTHIKDGVIYSGGATSADQIAYDNTNSGLEATNTQEAVDELSSDLTELSGTVADLGKSVYITGTAATGFIDIIIPNYTQYKYIMVMLSNSAKTQCYSTSIYPVSVVTNATLGVVVQYLASGGTVTAILKHISGDTFQAQSSSASFYLQIYGIK